MADKEWQNLMTDWQNCEVGDSKLPEEFATIESLQLRTAKKARRMAFFMWADVVSTLLFIGVFIYLINTSINIYQLVIFTGVIFLIIPMAVYSVTIRRGLWHANGNDTQAYLELALGRAKAGIKLAKANAIAALLAFPFIIGVITWRLLALEHEVSWPFNRYVFGLIFQLSLFTGLYYGARYYQRKKQKEYDRIAGIIADNDL